MKTKQQNIEDAADEVKDGADYHNYSLQASYEDWVNEFPTEQWLSVGVAKHLNLEPVGGWKSNDLSNPI